MLNLLNDWTQNCEGVDRRTLPKIGSLGGLGLTLPMLLKQKAACAKEKKTASDINCIFVWTLGGTSHHDTLDPKPNGPALVKGPFGVIDTAVPGVQFSEICPRMA